MTPSEVTNILRQFNAWLRANAPGGWIDDLRMERTELLARIKEMEKEREVLRDRLALESQENGALRDSVDRACEERDALRVDRTTLQNMVYSLKDRIEVVEKEYCVLESHYTALAEELAFTKSHSRDKIGALERELRRALVG